MGVDKLFLVLAVTSVCCTLLLVGKVLSREVSEPSWRAPQHDEKNAEDRKHSRTRIPIHGDVVPLRALRWQEQPFADFPEYRVSSMDHLIAEVGGIFDVTGKGDVTVSARSKNVSFEYPCFNDLPARKFENNKEPNVLLFVPWKQITYMSQDPLDMCPVGCELTNNPLDIPLADGYVVDTLGAMVNEPYNWLKNPLKRHLIAFNTENIRGRRKELAQAYGVRYLAKPWSEAFWSYFDVVISYQSLSMVHYPFYQWANCREDMLTQQRTRSLSKAQDAPVLFFARNCDQVAHPRQRFVKKLMQYIPVTSVGRCLNNRAQTAVVSCQRIQGNRRGCLISSYAFYLSIENSISLDYVTEKLYEPLMVGTIPIYLGAPNVENFLPTSHCAILATDFPTVKALAHYLRCVLRTPRIYHHYINWRERPLFRSFVDMQRMYPPLCQACMMIRGNSSRLKDPSYQEPKVRAGVFAENYRSQKPFEECLLVE